MSRREVRNAQRRATRARKVAAVVAAMTAFATGCGGSGTGQTASESSSSSASASATPTSVAEDGGTLGASGDGVFAQSKDDSNQVEALRPSDSKPGTNNEGRELWASGRDSDDAVERSEGRDDIQFNQHVEPEKSNRRVNTEFTLGGQDEDRVPQAKPEDDPFTPKPESEGAIEAAPAVDTTKPDTPATETEKGNDGSDSGKGTTKPSEPRPEPEPEPEEPGTPGGDEQPTNPTEPQPEPEPEPQPEPQPEEPGTPGEGEQPTNPTEPQPEPEPEPQPEPLPEEPVDTDGDGVPDEVEEQIGTDPNVVEDEFPLIPLIPADSDEDGVPDEVEEEIGTDPQTEDDEFPLIPLKPADSVDEAPLTEVTPAEPIEETPAPENPVIDQPIEEEQPVIEAASASSGEETAPTMTSETTEVG